MSKRIKELYNGISLSYIFISIYYLICNKILAKSMMESVTIEINNVINQSFYEKYIIILSILSIILNILFLKNFYNKKEDKNRAIAVINLLISLNVFQVFLSIVQIVLSFKLMDIQVNKKSIEAKKNEIPKIKFKKVKKHEIVSAVLLLLFYFSFDIFGFNIVKNLTGALILNTLFYIILIILCFLLFKTELISSLKKLNENINKYYKFIGKNLIIAYILEIIASLITMSIIGKYTSLNQQALENLPFLYLAISAIIFAPFTEEILFRGCLRRIIKNEKLFIIVSGVVFGLLHTISEPSLLRIIVVALPYIALGCTLAYTYVKSNNIWTNIFLHTTINTISCILLIFL